MLFRSKRQAYGDAEDEIRDDLLSEPSDLITDEDALPEDALPGDPREEDDADEADALLPPVPGPVIAAATFVPTFLAVVFGLSYLLGGATQPAHTANAPEGSAAASPLDALIAPPLVENAPPATVERSAPSPAVTLPPAQPQPAISSAPAPSITRSAEPSRRTPESTPRPAVESRKVEREWTPAAAFADREAAGRLASSIQQQGYPVEIRQEQSARPWVVWVGAQPRSDGRRR